MDSFVKMDVFFFVTTISVVVLTILLAVLIIYIIKIFSDVKYISKKAKTEADLVAEDLRELRANVKDKGAKLKYFVDFFKNLGKKRKNRKS